MIQKRGASNARLKLTEQDRFDDACLRSDSPVLYVAHSGKVYSSWLDYVFGEVRYEEPEPEPVKRLRL